MSDTLLIITIMVLGSIGILALFVGMGRVTYLLRKSEAENRKASDEARAEADKRSDRKSGD